MVLLFRDGGSGRMVGARRRRMGGGEGRWGGLGRRMEKGWGVEVVDNWGRGGEWTGEERGKEER